MTEPARFVVVDDSDPRIDYVGQWSTPDTSEMDKKDWGVYGPTWNHTLHSAQGSSSFSYRFNGTYFMVYGASDISDTKPAPTVQCGIDHVIVNSNPLNSGQWNSFRYCHGPLEAGEHLLTVNVTVPQGGNFLLDQIQYSPMTFPTTGETLKYQDTDASLVYEPTKQWGAGIGASHATDITGSTITINFSGTQFTAFGPASKTIPNDAYYTIDGGPPVSFVVPNKLGSADFNNLYHQHLFDATGLSHTEHKLVITFNGTNPDASPLALDFIHFTLPPSPANANSPQSSNTPGSSKSGTPVGAIVGGVVGGVVGLLVIILIAIVWRRRTRKKEDTEDMSIKPFMDETASSPRPPPAPVSMSQLPTDYSTSESRASLTSPVSSKGEPLVLAIPGAVRPLPQIRTHQDSGLRIGGGGGVIDVPPHYTED